MSLNVNWSNPYEMREGSWLKGNLHTHTDEGSRCGSVPTSRVLDLYVEAGFDFLAVSDHMVLTIPTRKGLVFIPGVEWNGPPGGHTGIYSMAQDAVRAAIAIDDQEQLLRELAKKDALVVLNHPNWQLVPHYRREALYSIGLFDGIEIYNAVIERLPGYAIATDKWDALLMNGQRVLGFASDDSHQEADIGLGWICVRSPARDAHTILDAMRRGNFYCSSGVVLSDIRREGNVITVESENAQEIQAIMDGGRRIARVSDSVLVYDVSGLEADYVRFAAYGPGASMAWTQPFFLR